VEIIHALVQMIRASPCTTYLPRTFSKIVYAGHSYGSLIGNGVNVKYPNDVDVTVLTGFSKTTIAFPGVLTGAVPAPADTVNTAKYGTLPVGYLEATSESGMQFSFFGSSGSFDPALFTLDYSLRETLTVGEGGAFNTFPRIPTHLEMIIE
jgi:hypothetical protein